MNHGFRQPQNSPSFSPFLLAATSQSSVLVLHLSNSTTPGHPRSQSVNLFASYICTSLMHLVSWLETLPLNIRNIQTSYLDPDSYFQWQRSLICFSNFSETYFSIFPPQTTLPVVFFRWEKVTPFSQLLEQKTLRVILDYFLSHILHPITKNC